MGEASLISTISYIVKEPTTNMIAFSPSACEEFLKVERRTWLQCGPLSIRRGVQFHPFGDCSVSNADLGSDVTQSPPSGVHSFDVDE
jgi:hypothetical protein